MRPAPTRILAGIVEHLEEWLIGPYPAAAESASERVAMVRVLLGDLLVQIEAADFGMVRCVDSLLIDGLAQIREDQVVGVSGGAVLDEALVTALNMSSISETDRHENLLAQVETLIELCHRSESGELEKVVVTAMRVLLADVAEREIECLRSATERLKAKGVIE